MNAESQPRYVEPNRGTVIFNAAVARLTKIGISVYGSRVLAVRGRKSGEWRTTPVNPLTIGGQRCERVRAVDLARPGIGVAEVGERGHQVALAGQGHTAERERDAPSRRRFHPQPP